MEKEYITINRNTYNILAKEYEKRDYSVKDDFYINTKFKGLNFKKGKKILEIGPGRGDKLKIFDDFGIDRRNRRTVVRNFRLPRRKARLPAPFLAGKIMAV